jgi:hypothetical protein
MEVKTRTQRTKGRDISDKWKDEIRNLYTALEQLARLGEFEDNQRIVKEIYGYFEMFFKERRSTKVMKNKYRHFFDREILEGEFTAKHRAEAFILEGEFTAKHGAEASLMEKMENHPKTFNGENILFRAMLINVKSEEGITTLDKIVKLIIQKCPELIEIPYHDIGITPVHLAILNENASILESMCNSLTVLDVRPSRKRGQDLCAFEPISKASATMAGTPLGVAALKCNEDIFKLTLLHFASGLDVTNDKGDTIIHSLIKYACVQPEKLDDIQRMLSYILQCKFDSGITDNNVKLKHKKEARIILMLKNKDNLNVMQLAAREQQFKLFEIIMKSEVRDMIFSQENYSYYTFSCLLGFVAQKKKPYRSSALFRHKRAPE